MDLRASSPVFSQGLCSLVCGMRSPRSTFSSQLALSRPRFLPALGVCGTSPVLQQGTDLEVQRPPTAAFLWPLTLGQVVGEGQAQRSSGHLGGLRCGSFPLSPLS